MILHTWRRWFRSPTSAPAARRRPRVRLCCESLEDRCVPAITLTGLAITPTEGAAFNGKVATLTDPTPAGLAGTINWGDGSTSPADGQAVQVIADPVINGQFDVVGTHTYTSAGAFKLQVTVTDAALNAATTAFFNQANLVTDNQTVLMNLGYAAAAHVDTNLVNPWGVAYAPGGPFWVSDNGMGVRTLYDGSGTFQGLFTIAASANTGATTPAPVTGTVYNGTGDFVVGSGAASGPALFIFATEDGTIAGWNPVANAGTALLKVDNSNFSTGPVYKGLAIGNNGTGNFLYATNFRAGTVDVFDKNYAKVTLAGTFTDPNNDLTGFAPFGIQNIGNQLYVTYAMQDATKHDDVAGAGNGFVDVFDLSGHFVKRLASHGTLNSPWGLALAPASFGVFANDLLVGNFGDGHIGVFDPNTDAFLGQLTDAKDQPLAIDGLWALTFGNNGSAGSANTLFFTAGINDEQDGLFGSATAVDTSTATVSGDVVISGTGNNDTLTLTRTAGGGTGAISYVLNGGTSVPLTAATSFTFNGLGGNDTFTLDAVNGAPSLSGGISFDGGTGSNRLVVDESTQSTGLAITVSANQVVSQGAAFTVNYKATGGTMAGGVVVTTGTAADIVQVLGTVTGATTTVNTGGGDDTIIIGSAAGTLDTLAGALTVDGGAGANQLYVSEANRASADVVGVTANLIFSQQVPFVITYLATGGTFARNVFVILGSAANNQLYVYGTAAGSSYGLYPGNGNNTVVISSPAGALDTFPGPVALSAGSGHNVLYVSEANRTAGDVVGLTSGFVFSQMVPFVITYAGAGGTFSGAVDLFTGIGDDNVFVYGTTPGSSNNIFTGAGNDDIIITSATLTLNALAGAVSVDAGSGSNLLYVSEAGRTTADTVYLTGQAIFSQVTPFFITFAATGGTFNRGIFLYTGTANNVVNVYGQFAGAPTEVLTGPGNNMANVLVTASSAFSNLTIDGGAGADSLDVFDVTGGATAANMKSGTNSGILQVFYNGGMTSSIGYLSVGFQGVFSGSQQIA